MRSLTVILYLFIMGCLVLATTVADYIEADYYAKEVKEDYLDYARLVTKFISPQLLAADAYENVLARYREDLESTELKDLIMINLDKSASTAQAFVADINITHQTDYITVVVPLGADKFNNKALQFQFQDSYSDNYMDYYLGSSLGIFVFMGLVISVLAWIIYRYIHQLSWVSRQVANGHFQYKMPSSRIPAVQALSNDINKMAIALDEKATENAILCGAIHHELRIPITRIRLELDMALNQCRSTQVPGDLHSLLQDMDVDIEEFIKLTEELLTISRLSLTGENVPTSDLSILNLVTETLNRIDCDKLVLIKASDFSLNANQTLMERALANIVNNAVKYAHKKIHISILKNQRMNRIRIEDDGPGIPENERLLILKPFYRIDKSRNRNTGGFGLGLAIANMVVKHTKGQLQITNSQLGGACIELSWSTNEQSAVN